MMIIFFVIINGSDESDEFSIFFIGHTKMMEEVLF